MNTRGGEEGFVTIECQLINVDGMVENNHFTIIYSDSTKNYQWLLKLLDRSLLENRTVIKSQITSQRY